MATFDAIEELRFTSRTTAELMATLFGVQCQMQPSEKKALTEAQWTLIDESLDGVSRADITSIVASFHDVAGPRLSVMPTGVFALTMIELIKLETYALQIAWPARLRNVTRNAVPGPVVTAAIQIKYEWYTHGG